MSTELEREIGSLEKLVKTNNRLIKTYEKMDKVTDKTKNSLEKLSSANAKLNERIEKLSVANEKSLLTDKKKEKSTNLLSSTFSRLGGVVGRLNKTTERKNINFTKSMFIFMRTYYMVRSLASSFQALSDTMVGLEGEYLRGEALLRVYGDSMDSMFDKLKNNFGIGRTTASSALSVLSEQLLQMNMSGEKLASTMSRVSDVTQMISGVSGQTFKESANILARAMAGNTRGLAGAVGFRMDDRLLSGLSPEMKGMEVLKQLENYLIKTQTGGIYLNNKTIAQMKESFVDGFRDMFHKIYQTLGGERMGSGYNLLTRLFGGLNISRITEGLYHFFDLFDKASKNPKLKELSNIISETLYFMFTYPLEILGNIGLVKLIGKLGALKTLFIIPLMNLLNLVSDGKFQGATDFVNNIAKQYYKGFKSFLGMVSDADFPILSPLADIVTKLLGFIEKIFPYITHYTVTMTRFADKILSALDALLDMISNPTKSISTFKKYREERDKKQDDFFGRPIDKESYEDISVLKEFLLLPKTRRTYSTLEELQEINPKLYEFSKKMKWIEEGKEYDALAFDWFLQDAMQTATRNMTTKKLSEDFTQKDLDHIMETSFLSLLIEGITGTLKPLIKGTKVGNWIEDTIKKDKEKGEMTKDFLDKVFKNDEFKSQRIISSLTPKSTIEKSSDILKSLKTSSEEKSVENYNKLQETRTLKVEVDIKGVEENSGKALERIIQQVFTKIVEDEYVRKTGGAY